MLAAFTTATNPEEPLSALRVGERPAPEVPEGWARVRVRAASLNRHDLNDDELDIDPRDPLGQRMGEQPAVRDDMEIDLRDGRQPGVRVVTGSLPTVNGGSH